MSHPNRRGSLKRYCFKKFMARIEYEKILKKRAEQAMRYYLR